jgi:hypothetical protein
MLEATTRYETNRWTLYYFRQDRRHFIHFLSAT